MHRKLATGMRGFAATLVATSITCGAALAQDWPSKTIRAIVPLTAGSATDLIARAVLDQVASRLGQPIVVENRPGAGNTIGMAAAARSDPDGYTVLVNSSSQCASASPSSAPIR
jgi:tripartite-type tricarboxylate transporter receptor subunit TctC